MTHRRSSRVWWLIYGGLLLSYAVVGVTVTVLHRRGLLPEFRDVRQIWWLFAIPFLIVAIGPWIGALIFAPVIVWAGKYQDRYNRSRGR